MKLTYRELKKIINAADAVMVDGNLTFPDVQDHGIDLAWHDDDGTYEYSVMLPDDGPGGIVATLRKDGSIKARLDDTDGSGHDGDAIIVVLTKQNAKELL